MHNITGEVPLIRCSLNAFECSLNEEMTTYPHGGIILTKNSNVNCQKSEILLLIKRADCETPLLTSDQILPEDFSRLCRASKQSIHIPIIAYTESPRPGEFIVLCTFGVISFCVAWIRNKGQH